MNFQYFAGKICTIFTTPINREFKTENPVMYPQQLINYFVGVVESCDEDGILISHDKLKTWISKDHLVAVAEEKEELVPVNQKNLEAMAFYKKQDKQEKKEESKFINLSAIEKLSDLYVKK